MSPQQLYRGGPYDKVPLPRYLTPNIFELVVWEKTFLFPLPKYEDALELHYRGIVMPSTPCRAFGPVVYHKIFKIIAKFGC